MTNEELRSLIPNVIHEVEGETLLVDKLAPWLASAARWLTDNFVGEDYSLPETLLPLAKNLIVFKAFADAVPSLDITLSPAGFAVINTDGRAPASKERVERLVASLRSFIDSNLPPFILSLLRREDWRGTPMGDYWLSTFMFGLEDANDCKSDKDLLTTYRLMRGKALRFQMALEQFYLGKQLLREVRSAGYESVSDDRAAVWRMLHNAVLKHVTCKNGCQGLGCPDLHELWHFAQPILHELRSCGTLYRIWEAEMGARVRVEPFKNTVRGGFFF